MSISAWVIVSWVFVALITGINIFLFLKLKKASEDMLKMAFPGAKNLQEAVGQMQTMMGGIQSAQKRGKYKRGAMKQNPFGPGAAGSGNDAQLKAAMELLQKRKR